MGRYDISLFKEWCKTEDYETYMEKKGIIPWSEPETSEYYSILNDRIAHLKAIPYADKGHFIYYTIAYLYNLYEGSHDTMQEAFFKRNVRCYCIKCIRMQPDYAPAWVLIAEAYDTILGNGLKWKQSYSVKMPDGSEGMEEENPEARRRILEKSLTCIKRAINIEPLNDSYKKIMNHYQWQWENYYAKVC